MANRYNWKPPCSKEQMEKMYNANMTQTEIAEKLGVTQKVIWHSMKKLGIKARVAKKRNQKKENNPNWKGNNVRYAMAHKRVENIRGKPKLCEVCGTTKAKRYEWANLTGNYTDLLDYQRMCKSCHAKHDKIINNLASVGGDALCQRK